ncbi:MAG: biotin--[acetyl-CoA-carboxylase] ligase [Minwuia sp.]|uniref:biotin--[acetyl-CoA-carboxylase] ligase n=1 Tax=Minwuia sp. TaxID=2493630 RepID=UPI003A839EFA
MSGGGMTAFAFRRIALGDVGSTNDEARARLGELDDGPFVVTGERQLQGRGRRGRDWVSPEGNLYASFTFRPGAPVARLPELSFVAALSVCDMARLFVPDPEAVRCKWPNDVLIDGAKVSGILLETARLPDGDYAIIAGIGVNVVSSPAGTPYPTASLEPRAAGLSVDAVLRALSDRFAAWIVRWRAEGFAVIRDAWLERADGLGQPVVARLADRELHGRFHGLGEDGALMLENESGDVVRIAAADIFRPVS